jgi:predicted LPLAT superfamily acyltransferase
METSNGRNVRRAQRLVIPMVVGALLLAVVGYVLATRTQEGRPGSAWLARLKAPAPQDQAA